MAVNDREQLNGGQAQGPALKVDEIHRALAGSRPAHRLHYFLELDSTNTYARRLADSGASEGEIVIAEQQTNGRGRLGRCWISPPFVNLYLSVVLRPVLPPHQAPQITLMAAVAVADAIAAVASQPPSIKWPNDIVIGGKKLAGILTESSSDSRAIDFVILGIGVNLNFPEADMPAGIRERATSLMEFTAQPVQRERFAARLIQDLDRCYGILQESGFAEIASRWDARFTLRGKRVRVEMIEEEVHGTARGIDKDGALIVEDDRGDLQRVIAGDVIPLET
jgi:BirA family biotin operon repressor/biotin-[acetyl-CoA-carboxylase] ligase